MLRKSIGLIVLLSVAGMIGPARAQEFTAVIDRDIRVFTVVAALNAAGFDAELAPRYHPVREQVRERLASLDPDLVARLEDFYRRSSGGASEEQQLARYISLALSVTDPPGFQFMYSEESTPPDARELAGFLPLLDEFYEAADITRLWSLVGPSYEAELDRIVVPLRETIIRSDAYLRVPLGSSGVRQLVIFLELAAPVNSVNVRNYPDNLYIVLGHSPTPPVRDVRHAYLHLLLDPVVARSRGELTGKRVLGGLIQDVEGVQPEYASDFEILVTESLIRAVELRMDRAPADETQASLDAAYRSGLLLAPYFHEKLAEFELSDAGIRTEFPRLITAVQVTAERQRFQERFHSIPARAEAPVRFEVPPPVDPVPGILREAQTAFNAGDDEAAREAFERILEEVDATNGPALYGMGLIASREEDPELAREYFTRTLESDSADPSMRVWAHVYLGRIYDIECQRESALEHYRSALEVGDDTEGARAAARSGIDQPFGGGC